MQTIDKPFLDDGTRDGSVVMPALRKLVMLACSQDTDQQVEVNKMSRLLYSVGIEIILRTRVSHDRVRSQ